MVLTLALECLREMMETDLIVFGKDVNKIGLIHTQVDHMTLVTIQLDGFEVGHQGSAP